MIGILAYGSLISDPGSEINERIERIIKNVETPFAVEYARRSMTRSCAPTLVPVPIEKGISVNASVMVLKEDTQLPQVLDMLYRREIHRVGDSNKVYKEPADPDTHNLRIMQEKSFAGLDIVLYTKFPANFGAILDNSFSNQEKADLLCSAACESLTKDTFQNELDGIQYLTEAINSGVKTCLTELYKQAILRKAGTDIKDLQTARQMIAESKGLFP
jgi:hypothetical protein